MIRIRIIGLALVAVFAMSAVVAVSSASAATTLPAYVRCAQVVTPGTGAFELRTCEGAVGTKEFIKVYLGGVSLSATEECAETVAVGAGTFENAGCTTVGTGAKDFIKVFKTVITFTSTSGVSILKTASGEEVECKADTNAGELTGAKTDIVTVTFTGCESKKFKCSSAGAAAGEIVVKEALSELGYIKKAAPTEVGLALKPKEAGGIFVEFNCAGGIVKVKTKGSVIGKITPINTWTTTYSLVFNYSAGNPCKQEFEKFEGLAKDTLESSKNGGAYEGACEKSTDTITLSEKGEIRA